VSICRSLGREAIEFVIVQTQRPANLADSQAPWERRRRTPDRFRQTSPPSLLATPNVELTLHFFQLPGGTFVRVRDQFHAPNLLGGDHRLHALLPKQHGKTVSLALSREQYEWLSQVIINWRQVQKTLKEMQRLSRQVLFATVPHPPRRKRLSKKVLGLI